MASEYDEPTPRSPMTKCEVLRWFFGSRFACDARPDRCAKCPAHVTAHAAERYRRHMGDSKAICGDETTPTGK